MFLYRWQMFPSCAAQGRWNEKKLWGQNFTQIRDVHYPNVYQNFHWMSLSWGEGERRDEQSKWLFFFSGQPHHVTMLSIYFYQHPLPLKKKFNNWNTVKQCCLMQWCLVIYILCFNLCLRVQQQLNDPFVPCCGS